MLESTYSIKNGKIIIREINKNREKELIDVVEINRSNVKNGIETRLKTGRGKARRVRHVHFFLHGV